MAHPADSGPGRDDLMDRLDYVTAANLRAFGAFVDAATVCMDGCRSHVERQSRWFRTLVDDYRTFAETAPDMAVDGSFETVATLVRARSEHSLRDAAELSDIAERTLTGTFEALMAAWRDDAPDGEAGAEPPGSAGAEAAGPTFRRPPAAGPRAVGRGAKNGAGSRPGASQGGLTDAGAAE